MRIELTPPEVEIKGVNEFKVIGEDCREALEYRPSPHVVVHLVRKKFFPKETEFGPASTRVAIVALSELPIERGLAGPGVLADALVRRWQDYQLPHRLGGIYEREGMRPVAQYRLRMAHGADGARSSVAQGDETGRVVLLAPDKHVLFEYSARHAGAASDQLPASYEGYLVAELSVYDRLYRHQAMTEVACWAHCRRYFIKALESKSERAK